VLNATDRSRTTRARRLPGARLGVVPILWNNVDLADLAPPTPMEAILDVAVALGYEGVQFGRGFPEAAALRTTLASRGLTLAELYAELPCTPDGPTDEALAIGRARLALLHAAGGEVLVPACRVGGGREVWAGRGHVPGAPRFTAEGWTRFAAVVETLGREAAAQGHLLAFHPHSGTFVETPDEVERFAERTDPELVSFCVDVAHLTVGGGDPVDMIGRLGTRVRHCHLKDVDGDVLRRLRAGEVADFDAAIRARLFTELGHGVVDVDGVFDVLERLEYAGWLMSEQDSTWRDPADAAAASRATIDRILGGVA
jgi:inosose dehydratase